jgi:hypothetical protein
LESQEARVNISLVYTPMRAEEACRWSIWPETLQRNDVGKIIGADRLRPTAHQFYGEWRIVDLDDGLPQYIGYEGQSNRVG